MKPRTYVLGMPDSVEAGGVATVVALVGGVVPMLALRFAAAAQPVQGAVALTCGTLLLITFGLLQTRHRV